VKALKIKKELLAAMGKTRSRLSKIFRKTTGFLWKNKKNFTSNFNQEQADKNLVYSLASSKIPNSEQMKHLNKTLSKKESLIIKIALGIALINLVYLGVRFYKNHTEQLPLFGGVYTEGLVGYPKNVNPLYSSNRDVDADLAKLIYSGLYRYDKNGTLVNDLAEKIETEDNKTFVVTLKKDLKWHSGETLTVDDVIFTFHLITNPDYNSPLRKSFSAVVIEKVSDNQIKFILPSAYAAFSDLLTFGIMPQSVWDNVSPDSALLNDLNLQPIGSGPYKFSSLIKSKQGEIKEYRLVVNDYYYGQKPYIKEIYFKFYPELGELISAFNDGDVLGLSYLPLSSKHSIVTQNSLNFHSLNSFQEDLLFFNADANKNLADLNIRRALALAIDKNSITKELFENFYQSIDGPLPANSFAYNDSVTKYSYNPEEANAKLEEAGWSRVIVSSENINSEAPEIKAIIAYASSTGEKTEGAWRFKKDKKDNVSLLTVKLTVVEGSESLVSAQRIKLYWDAIGVRTTLDLAPSSNISNLISSRSFETIIFGQILGADPDVFAFWHSSQVGNRGLNISGYKNDKVDQFLEAARISTDVNSRIDSYKEVQRIIADELPAIFLYEKKHIYVQSKKLKGFSSTTAVTPSDRFADVSNWFIKSNNKFSW
jgi:peptide/nickel transport system substrate-binding protein